jgi:hypothetical protein
MKIPIEKVLEITQMIVPEIDISYQIKENQIYIPGIEFKDWHYYLDAMENASDLLLIELAKLPDVAPITEIEPISTDLNCLISFLNMSYFAMKKKLEEIDQKYKSSSNDDLTRFSRYRSNNHKTGTDE